MKKNVLLTLLFVLTCSTFAKTSADTLVVTTQPQMHCINCEKKIKSLSFGS